MATAPVKSQTLHNFSLPFLKWGHKNQLSTGSSSPRFHRMQHRQKTVNSPSRSEQCQGQNEDRLPPSQQDSDSDLENPSKVVVGSRTPSCRISFTLSSQQRKEQPPSLQRQERDGFVEEETKEDIDAEEGEREECGGKPWNLRPRKVVKKVGMEMGTFSSKNGEQLLWNEINTQTMRRLRAFGEGGQGAEERNEKTKLWISLSREEIEEDVYAFTGAKPSRRPKKRPKTIQKHLDNVFPGLYLVGVTADSYRVHDALL